MRILCSEEIHFQPTDVRFGPSKAKLLTMLIILTAVFSMLLILTAKEKAWIVFTVMAAVCGLFFLILLSGVINSFRKDSWKVAIQNACLLLKTERFESSETDAIEIAYSEIRSIRKLREEYFSYKRKKGRVKADRKKSDSLDVELSADAFGQLAALARPDAIGFQLIEPNRLIYPAASQWLNAEAILDQLKPYCQVREVHHVTHDKPDIENPQQIDGLIVFLAQKGHQMDAQNIAQFALGLGIRESREYVAQSLQKAHASASEV